VNYVELISQPVARAVEPTRSRTPDAVEEWTEVMPSACSMGMRLCDTDEEATAGGDAAAEADEDTAAQTERHVGSEIMNEAFLGGVLFLTRKSPNLVFMPAECKSRPDIRAIVVGAHTQLRPDGQIEARDSQGATEYVPSKEVLLNPLADHTDASGVILTGTYAGRVCKRVENKATTPPGSCVVYITYGGTNARAYETPLSNVVEACFVATYPPPVPKKKSKAKK
jgi:hypothetical protein